MKIEEDEEDVCTSCEKPFDDRNHKLALVHPNLFGGVDRLCKSCAIRMEGQSRKAIEMITKGTGKA